MFIFIARHTYLSIKTVTIFLHVYNSYYVIYVHFFFLLYCSLVAFHIHKCFHIHHKNYFYVVLQNLSQSILLYTLAYLLICTLHILLLMYMPRLFFAITHLYHFKFPSMSSPGSRKTPLQQPMLPNTTRDAINARRRLLYKQKKDRQNAHRRLTLISTHGNINDSINPTPMHTSTTPPPRTTPFPDGHTCFLNRLSRLHPLRVCSICKESYPKMKTNFSNGIYTCSRCSNE